MANTYKNAGVTLTTTDPTTVYTCPAATTGIVQAVCASNVDTVNDTTVTVTWTDDSNADADYSLITGASVPKTSTLQVLDKPIVLEAGDTIVVTAGSANDLDVTVSVLQIS